MSAAARRRIRERKGKPKAFRSLDVTSYITGIAIIWFVAGYSYFAGLSIHLPARVWEFLDPIDISLHFLSETYIVFMFIAFSVILLGSHSVYSSVTKGVNTFSGTRYDAHQVVSPIVGLTMLAVVFLQLDHSAILWNPVIPQNAIVNMFGMPLLGSLALALVGLGFFRCKERSSRNVMLAGVGMLWLLSVVFFWGDINGSLLPPHDDSCLMVEGQSDCHRVVVTGSQYTIIHTAQGHYEAVPSDRISAIVLDM